MVTKETIKREIQYINKQINDTLDKMKDLAESGKAAYEFDEPKLEEAGDWLVKLCKGRAELEEVKTDYNYYLGAIEDGGHSFDIEEMNRAVSYHADKYNKLSLGGKTL